jgi:Ca-activated chloride channel family protein
VGFADGRRLARPVGRAGRFDPGFLDTEQRARFIENAWVESTDEPQSSFAIDVDTASYQLSRRWLREGRTPPAGNIRIEEFINYFRYDYAGPTGPHPFAAHLECAPSPFNDGAHLLRIALKGREINKQQRPPANLVFLIDVSGSMSDEIALVRETMKTLTRELRTDDTISMWTYASSTGVVLSPTPVKRRSEILEALGGLKSGGSTSGEAGIRLAYRVAREARSQQPESISRIILCTDGDFNVGLRGDDLVRVIESHRDDGIYLSGLLFGRGNLRDPEMETYTNKGNGNYGYIENEREIDRVCGEALLGMLQTIAKDVKLQVVFNPNVVAGYRLIGYENRVMTNEEFEEKTTDAGELGAGHTVTAFYEVKMVDVPVGEDPPEVQTPLVTLRVRYKTPDAVSTDESTEFRVPLAFGSTHNDFDDASEDFRFAAGVAQLAQLWRESKHADAMTYATATKIVYENKGDKRDRREFVDLSTKVAQNINSAN